MGPLPGAALLLLAGLTSATGPVPTSISPDASCAICHEDVVAIRRAGQDVHTDLLCSDCHAGRSFNPHVSPEPRPGDDAQAKLFAPFAKTSPGSWAACVACHADQAEQWAGSIHAAGSGKAPDSTRPGCDGCHGSPHDIRREAGDKRTMAVRCARCHNFAGESGPPANPMIVDTYRDTLHGKMLALGNHEAAACADCHGGHAVYAGSDPRSSVNPARVGATCARCHPNATAAFAAASSHPPRTIDEDFWSWAVSLFFSTLVLLTIFFLFLHISMDFFRTGRLALKGHAPPFSPQGPVPADEPLVRFDLHARIQHWGMMIAFTTLVLTGWPLKSAAVGTSATLARAMGGHAFLALLHRAAGILMLLVAAYHVTWLVWRWKKGILRADMIPSLRDFRDVWHNVLYFFGLRAERPNFGRWAYYEKFDYWAKSWGVFIMAATGFILWFPVPASNLLPAKLIAISQIAHSYEALLAALAIFLWHFYNVHLRPTVFPMSWVWLNGRITAEQLWDEHHAEYERLYGATPPAPPRHHPTWHQRHVWSYAALSMIVIVAILVVASDVGSIRERIQVLQRSLGPPAAPVAPGVASVYTPGFDVYGTCFHCHGRERYEGGGAGFPHKMHFEDAGVERACDRCHAGTGHQGTRVSMESCSACHDPVPGAPPEAS